MKRSCKVRLPSRNLKDVVAAAAPRLLCAAAAGVAGELLLLPAAGEEYGFRHGVPHRNDETAVSSICIVWVGEPRKR